MAGAIAEGYTVITTDSGSESVANVSPWALLSPGNANLHALQNVGSVSLNDEVSSKKRLKFGKDIVG
jgi:hypothetical protein